MALMRALLKLLRERIGTPVDIEFASDGKDLYLLQCRPQSFSSDAVPSAIPRDLPHGTGGVRRQQVRVERPRARRHAHRLRGPGGVRPPREPQRHEGRRARHRTAQQAAAEASVRPDGARPLGQPRRHQAGRQRHLLGHQQHRRAHRDRGEEGELRAGPLVRHSLLPGPRRGGHPLPAALPRRTGPGLQRRVPPPRPEHVGCPAPRVRAPLAGRPRHRRGPGDRRPRAPGADERRPRRGGRVLRRADPGPGHVAGAPERHPPDHRGPLALAPPDGRAHRGGGGPGAVRDQGDVRLRQHEERHGRRGQRHRPDRPRGRQRGVAETTGDLARGLEPLPQRDELPADRATGPTGCWT